MIATKIKTSLAARYTFSGMRSLLSPAPRRPLVLILSDDWGRSGAPSINALDVLVREGLLRSVGPWDRYGLETVADLEALTASLTALRDCDNRPACLTANIVVANLAIAETRGEAPKQEDHVALGGLTLVPLDLGLPPPWEGDLPAAYRASIDTGAFWPALHGLTHFSIPILAAALRDPGEFGRRAKALLDKGIPYLRSVTPEFSFALSDASGGSEKPIGEAEQLEWLQAGIAIFERLFGRRPASFCPPGYRHDRTTLQLLEQFGISSIQAVNPHGFVEFGGLLVIGRNVAFEPVLEVNPVEAIVVRAFNDAMAAYHAGRPIVICSHSINYIDRHVGRAKSGRAGLKDLLTRLLDRLPNLRFCHVDEATAAWECRDPTWFRAPRASEFLSRIRPTQ